MGGGGGTHAGWQSLQPSETQRMLLGQSELVGIPWSSMVWLATQLSMGHLLMTLPSAQSRLPELTGSILKSVSAKDKITKQTTVR
jgi:hypothetical protein